MTSSQNVIKELNEVMDDGFPTGFLEAFDMIELLGRGRGTQTYLVMRRDTKALYVAKRYDRSVCGGVHESDILKLLRHPGLPAFAEEFQDENFICVVREYVHGTPLSEALDSERFPRSKAVSICSQLCDTLIYLHGQNPPVIHRDIKPSNIILRDDGSIALIDFDIARTLAADAEADTVVVGTRDYAPPEQYGFAQTDARTDIYALGVLLCRMLTGSADVRNANIDDRRLARIVRRCTAFSPESRFQNASAVKRALQRAKGCKNRTRPALAAAALICLCAVGALFFLNRAPARSSVIFQEPLMEMAVRAQLGKGASDPLSEDDLMSVRSIYIFGEKTFASQEAFDEWACSDWGETPRGSLVSLADTAILPNLETLCVNYQALQDISGLAASDKLAYVNLSQTHISDASPLARLANIQQAHLYATRVNDLSSLNACQKLEVLEIGETGVSKVESLPLKAPIKILSLKRLTFTTLEGISSLSRLGTLLLNNASVSDFSALLTLPSLKLVYLSSDMEAASRQLANAPFEVVYE